MMVHLQPCWIECVTIQEYMIFAKLRLAANQAQLMLSLVLLSADPATPHWGSPQPPGKEYNWCTIEILLLDWDLYVLTLYVQFESGYSIESHFPHHTKISFLSNIEENSLQRNSLHWIYVWWEFSSAKLSS